MFQNPDKREGYREKPPPPPPVCAGVTKTLNAYRELYKRIPANHTLFVWCESFYLPDCTTVHLDTDTTIPTTERALHRYLQVQAPHTPVENEQQHLGLDTRPTKQVAMTENTNSGEDIGMHKFELRTSFFLHIFFAHNLRNNLTLFCIVSIYHSKLEAWIQSSYSVYTFVSSPMSVFCVYVQSGILVPISMVHF